jgi:hypothetical protein
MKEISHLYLPHSKIPYLNEERFLFKRRTSIGKLGGLQS